MSTLSATRQFGPSENRPISIDEVEVNRETEESAQDQSQDNNLKRKRKFTSKMKMLLAPCLCAGSVLVLDSNGSMDSSAGTHIRFDLLLNSNLPACVSYGVQYGFAKKEKFR